MTSLPPLDPKYLSLLWAGPERAEEISELHARHFNPAWDAATVRGLLDHPGSTCLVALVIDPNRPTLPNSETIHKIFAGYVMAQLAADEAEILSIGVDPDWQRRGLGGRLVEGLIRAVKRAEAKRLFLEVAADNDAAFALYQRLGFTAIGLRKGYYDRQGGSTVDAMTLALKL